MSIPGIKLAQYQQRCWQYGKERSRCQLFPLLCQFFLQVCIVSQCNNWNDIHWPVAACIHFDDVPLFWWNGVTLVQFISNECMLWLGRSLVIDGALSIHGRTVIAWGTMMSGAMQYRGTMILVVFMMLMVLMVLVLYMMIVRWSCS